MPNLADSLMLRTFLKKLEHLEKPSTQTHLTNWENRFVEELREKYEERETQADLGCPVWNPSASQWNVLHELWEKTT